MKGKPLQVLLVEDSAGDARLLREMFSKEMPGSFVLTHVERMSDALRHLAKGGLDIVLLDMGLPDGHGLDTVRRAQAAAPGVPLIVLTGLDDEAAADQAMKEGAQDYLIKGQIENRALPRALRHAIERHRMQAETDLLRKQQLQLKDEFLSHVSHELRSPLTAIYQFVTILLDGLEGELNPTQREYLQISLKNIRQLKSMIDDLLEVTRLQAGKARIELQLTSIPDLVVDTVTSLQATAAAKGITLSSDITPLVTSAYADPTRVRQILIILLDNALKFTPANGVVKVRARVFDTDPRFFLVEISDSGCGIQPEMIEQIFERLYQAPDTGQAGRKGLGLGLHICKELVTRQGGHIWARSEPGKGAILSFTLPIFSVAGLITPAFRIERSAENSIALVVTELGSESGWLSRGAAVESSHQVRDALRRCMHSELDVLLPKMGPAAGTEFFFIVAVTDTIGGEAITKRVREKLAGCDQIQQTGLTYSVSYRLLRSADRSANESIEDYVGRMAMKIQETVDEVISPRMVKNEQ
jgi:signal transduction histidine kinase